MANWCLLCCTDHPSEGRCPGELMATGPEQRGWKVTVETPSGFQAYGVLVAESGKYWRARILTYPNVLWTTPGGHGSMKPSTHDIDGLESQLAELHSASFGWACNRCNSVPIADRATTRTLQSV